MAETQVKTPEGRIIRVRHPDGATDAEILAYAKANSSGLSLNNSMPSMAPPKEGLPAQLYGAGEAVVGLGTGMVAGMASSPVAGLAALGDIGLRNAAGLQEPSPTSKIVDKYTVGGFQPRTETGQRMMQNVARPFQAMDQFFTEGGNKVQDSMIQAQQATGRDLEGYPEITAALATGVKFTPDVLATILGLKIPRSPMRRAADVGRAEATVADLGVDIRAPYRDQTTQLQEGMQSRFSPNASSLDGLDEIPGAIGRERQVQSRRIGTEIRGAEQMGAEVPSRTAGTLADNLRASVSPFASSSMPAIVKLLDQADKFGIPARQNISELMGVRNNAKVPVSDIFGFREAINANLPSDRRSPEYAALNAMKREVDGYLNDSLVNDLVSGNPEAITKYQDAITQWSDFKDLFDGNRILKKLQDEDATPEQIKGLLLGMNAVRAPRQAANVVTRLRAILGDDSPEFKSIQQSVLTDILLPALDPEPNWKKTGANIDLFLKNNSTLANELLDTDTVKDLRQLGNFASALDKTAPLDVKVKNAGFERMAAVFTAGNQLSRGAMRVNLVTRIIGALKPNMGDARKNAIIAQMIGYNPRQSLFTTEPVRNVAALQTFRQVPEDQREFLQSMQEPQ